MSSNNQRSTRRTAATTRQTRQTAVEESTATRRNNRTCVRAVACDKKTYFVDSDDEIEETKVSPSKRTKQTNGTTNGLINKATSSKVNSEQLDKLVAITGIGRSEGMELLEACENSLERAIEIHFGGGLGDTKSKKVEPMTNGRGVNNKHANKRSHKEIDSDLNEAIAISDDSNSQSSSNYNNDDGVRAPIAPTFARLCDYDPYAVELPVHKRSRVDGFRNMREEFNDSLAAGSSRKKNFSTLFRPPIDLLFDGSFEASKVRACLVNKWVMLNVQSHDDFACKCLNRDLWSDETVKEIVKANFVFNQVYYDSVEGQKLINIYNIHSYPFIGIIDPRTGEKLIQLQSNKIDSCSFCEKITSFLCDFEMPHGDDEKSVPSNECVKVDDDDEVVELNNKNNLTDVNSKNQKLKAKDLLSSNDILEFESDDDDDNIKDMNDSYEDEAVISKDKYDRQKQDINSIVKPGNNIEKVEQTNKALNEEKLVNSNNINIPAPTETKPHVPKIFKYTTPENDKKDCALRISYPNGDRLDFSTNGDSKLKYLIEYLIKDGFRLDTHELIERLMPNFLTANKPTTSSSSDTSNEVGSILDITEQSRNLFHKDPNLTFKQLKLYPRVALLLQEA